MLARRLTPENHAALLTEASGRSKREVEEILARHYPQPDVPSSVRKLPTRVAETIASCPLPSTGLVNTPARLPDPTPASVPPPPSPPASPRPTVAPLAEDRYLVKFTVSRATQQKLKLAQDLLRHANPSGDPAEIFDRALTVLIDQLRRKKFAATTKPRPSRGVKPGSRVVPASLKRDAAVHDQERCSFVGTGGHRCGERAFVEFHHVEAVASGGVARKGMIGSAVVPTTATKRSCSLAGR